MHTFQAMLPASFALENERLLHEQIIAWEHDASADVANAQYQEHKTDDTS